jgi:dTDP-4-amino-4,6-dideoxygalactose transaminase
VLEDACHAPGGWFAAPGGRVHRCGDGSLADLAIFSFHPVKHLTTGEGGLITTADPALHQRLLRLRSHGITRDPALMSGDPGGWYYEMMELGFNYRLTDVQAALGLSQLKRLDAYLEARRRQAARYREGLQGLPLQCLAHAPGHAYHLFVIRSPRRRELYGFLHEAGFGVQVHYIPVHLQPAYRALGWKPGDFPQAEAYYAECLSLPLYPGLPEAAQEAVMQAIRDFFR